MKTQRSPILFAFASTLGFFASSLFAAENVEVLAKVTALTVGAGNEQPAIKITFRSNGKDMEDVVLVSESQSFSPASYTLTDQNKEVISITPVIPGDVASLRLLSSVMLLPGKPLKRESQYVFTIKQGVFVFETVTGGVTNHTKNPEVALKIQGSSVSNTLDYIEKRQIGKSKVEFGAGSPGGLASIELVYDQSQFLGVDWMNLRGKANGDLTLDRADRGEYFNSLVGEAMFYRSVRIRDNYNEFSFGGKVESDQTFDLINAGFSAKWAWFMKNRITDKLGHIFQKDAVSVPPLLILSYDFFDNVQETNAVASADDSTHRITALIRYQLPIAKEREFKIPPLEGKYDLSVDFEIKGVYDSNTSKVHDQSWISLVIAPSSGPDRFKPALSFTWARGKAAPTFEQVNVFFAGLKLAF